MCHLPKLNPYYYTCCLNLGLNLITTKIIFRTSDYGLFFNYLLRLIFGAFLGFLLEISEYLVVGTCSSLSLSVAGIFKVSACF